MNEHDVDFLVVGGAAVSHYGYRRPSGIMETKPELKADLDFWYNPTIENFQNILLALDKLQVDTNELKKLVFDPQKTFLKIPHKLFHTDFLPIMEGLGRYPDSKAKSETVVLDGVQVQILSYEDLILNKRAIRRKIDEADINALEAIRKRKKGKHL